MRGALWTAAAALLLALAIVWTYRTVGAGEVGNEPVDALLVLGSPADLDGSLKPDQRWRVNEAVAEYRRGRAPRVLFSGGAAANRFVESEVMAAYAMQLGLPRSAILTETGSRTTVENLRESERVLDAHGWRRAEVISSPEHLPRAAVLLRHTHLQWRVHAAPTPGRGRLQAAGVYAEEAIGTAALRWFGTAAEPVLHAIATVQHAIGFSLRWVVYKTGAWVRSFLVKR